jgi:prepilin-type N-terminal cleavage/methylation domain-containing protein
MLRINKQGFTLIELMVVIVIIGVLASLAIPRFTEASAKAKVAEAPNVISAYETAFLAAIPELTATEIAAIKGEELIVDKTKDSKWFDYAFAGGDPGTGANSGLGYQAKAKENMGKFLKDGILKSGYKTEPQGGVADAKDCFKHETDGTIVTAAIGKAMVPSFLNSGCDAIK